MKREQFYEEMKKALMELKPEGMEVTFIKVDKQNRTHILSGRSL